MFVGATPFWLAARFRQPEMMRLPAQHHADVSHVQGRHSMGQERQELRVQHHETRRDHGSHGRTGTGLRRPDSGHRSAPSARAIALECVKVAVEAGAPVNAAVDDGRTALETAAALGYKSVVEYLTSKGAKLDRPARSPRREPRAEN